MLNKVDDTTLEMNITNKVECPGCRSLYVNLDSDQEPFVGKKGELVVVPLKCGYCGYSFSIHVVVLNGENKQEELFL